jgi:uncharacterized protein (DUF302 family)
MREVLHTVKTKKNFGDAVQAVEQKSVAHGFRVLHIHDVAATLAEKGFPREPLKIVEVCNARYASQALQKDVRTASLLPCPVTVYTEKGQTYISTMLPSVMADFFPDAGLEKIAAEVEAIVRKIVDEAKS